MNREVHVRFWESAGLQCLALLAYLKHYADAREAKAGTGAWLVFYNTQRFHSALGNRTPMAVWRNGAAEGIGGSCGYMDNARALPTDPQHQQQKQPLAA